MVYLNPQGHNYGSENLDGYGLSQVAFAVIYSLFFYPACVYLWFNRKHPILRMRKINLAILSLLILHVYLLMIFMVYMINGAFPCGVVSALSTCPLIHVCFVTGSPRRAEAKGICVIFDSN